MVLCELWRSFFPLCVSFSCLFPATPSSSILPTSNSLSPRDSLEAWSRHTGKLPTQDKQHISCLEIRPTSPRDWSPHSFLSSSAHFLRLLLLAQLSDTVPVERHRASLTTSAPLYTLLCYLCLAQKRGKFLWESWDSQMTDSSVLSPLPEHTGGRGYDCESQTP